MKPAVRPRPGRIPEPAGRFSVLSPIIVVGLFTTLLLVSGCQSGAPAGTPDYPVTIILPAGTPTPLPPVPAKPEPFGSPTLDWSQVTVLPLHTPGQEPDATSTVAPTAVPVRSIPDPLTGADVDSLAVGRAPFFLSDAELSLGRLVLPLDLLSLGQSFRVQSVEIDNHPGWTFLAFDLPLPTEGELGPVVRAPIPGEVMPGTMRMVNDQTVQTLSVDHPLTDDQLLRATFVYSGTVEPLYVIRQQVQAGEVLFRLTRDTGRLSMLGSTPIPLAQGAVLTLHASIDTITQQESGTESLRFLRGVSLTPDGFLQNSQGRVISPVH